VSTPPPHLTANKGTTVGVVNVVYPLPPSAVHPEGFGYLIPHVPGDVNPEGALGVVFDSTALPGLDGSLEGKVTKLTVMLGGPHWGSYTDARPPSSDAELTSLALAHLNRVFPNLASVEPLLAVPHLNRDCIPTYAPGHAQRLAQTHAALVGTGVSVVGAGYTGVSVNDCVYTADRVARALARGEEVTGLEGVVKQ
jgi:oxygen-dependent protoporphyrinogen oxidase